jgi:hypothetical protein
MVFFFDGIGGVLDFHAFTYVFSSDFDMMGGLVYMCRITVSVVNALTNHLAKCLWFF